MNEWEVLLYFYAPPWIRKTFSQRHNVRNDDISASVKNPLRSIYTQIVIATVYWEFTMFKTFSNVIPTRIR